MLDLKMQALDSQAPTFVARMQALANIYELEEVIKSMPGSVGKDSPLFAYHHWFVPGIYGREITIPANTVLTTEIHASENLAVVLQGSFTFFSENGLEYIEAPKVMVTKIGTKRAMFTHTEVIYITFHENVDNETDIDTLVERYTFKDEKAYHEYKQLILEVTK